MYFSINEFAADGIQTQWNFNFAGGYIDQAHVFVEVTDSLGAVTTPTFTWVGENTIEITPAVAAGSTLKVFRDTPKDLPLVDFTDGAIINERTLDKIAEQAIFVAAESDDVLSDALVASAASTAEAAAALALATTADANATTAIADSSAALAGVTGAIAAADAANAAATAATTAADTATTAATTATATAAAAEATANSAEATANGIAATANTALSTANAADTKADDAVTTANGIAATANAADSKADTAIADSATALAAANAAAPLASPALTGNPTAPTPALGDNDTSVATTAFVQNEYRDGFGSGSYGFKNKIINGDFAIAQRGTSSSAPGYGSVDRYRFDSFGSANTHSQQPFTPGQTDVPGHPAYYSRSVVTSVAGASNYAIVRQGVEDVRTFQGAPSTLTFWAKADASKNMAIEFKQVFGSGGSPDVTGIGVTTIALTTSWQKFTVTVTLPSITGKTIGSSHYVTPQFWFDAGSSYDARTNSLGQQSGTFDIAQIQWEEGAVATPFEQRPIGLELSLCQRYYWKQTFHVGTLLADKDSSNSGLQALYFATLPGMRLAPTVTVSGVVTSNITTLDAYSTPTIIQLVGGSTAAGRSYMQAQAGAYLAADAEL